MEPTQNQTNPAIPIAIICGFAMIALAIFFTNKNDAAPISQGQQIGTTSPEVVSDSSPRPVDETDYIFGNPNAPIQIIEYSDYECKFCKQFHGTLQQIMSEYGVSGKVSWIYRQYPLAQLHPAGPKISEAALCVGDLGDNEAFWKFTDRIFEERDEETFTNITRLPQYAVDAGVRLEDYNTCISSGRMQENVVASVEEGFKIGARSTPYTVITVGDQQAVINGAQSYDMVKGIVKNLIEQIDGTYQPSTGQ